METLPHFCVHCSSMEVESHCENPQCTWVKCAHCSKYTDVREPIPREE